MREEREESPLGRGPEDLTFHGEEGRSKESEDEKDGAKAGTSNAHRGAFPARLRSLSRRGRRGRACP